MNWGMLPFLTSYDDSRKLAVGDLVYVPMFGKSSWEIRMNTKASLSGTERKWEKSPCTWVRWNLPRKRSWLQAV